MSGKDRWKINDGKLCIVAPRHLWGELRQGLSRLYPAIDFRDEDKLDKSPYSRSVNSIASGLDKDKDYLLIVTGAKKSAGKVIDSFLPYGIPTGFVPAKNGKELRNWLDSLKHTEGSSNVFSVLSMWKDFYLKWADLYASSLDAGYSSNGNRIVKWYADELLADDVSASLASGPSLAIYLGHGRSRGWTGYRGLRWHHIENQKKYVPLGVLMSITCKNLLIEHNQVPFGMKWIISGRARTFIGAVHDVKINPLIKISHKFTEIFRKGKHNSVSGILREMDRDIKSSGNRDMITCWNRFRLIGDPAGIF